MKKVQEIIKSYSRFLFVLMALGAAFLFIMFQGGLVSWTIFYAALPFLMYSIILFFYPLSRLKVTRDVKTQNIRSGGKLRVIVTIKRKLRFPLLYIVLSERWKDDHRLETIAGKSHKLFIFGFRKELVFPYELADMPRGAYLLEGIDIELMDFFLWIRKKRFVRIKNSIFVYPKVIDMQFNPAVSHLDHGMASTVYSIMQDTTTVTSVRNYEPGDRISLIHWKSFARTGELMTKEFEDSKSQETFLVLDCSVSAALEEQISLVASIIKAAKSAQVGIGFMAMPKGESRLGMERNVFPSIKTETDYDAVFRYLAMVEPVQEKNIEIAVAKASDLTKRGTVLVITGNPDWLFLQSVLGSSFNPSAVICFVIVANELSTETEIMKNIEIAKHKGINVQVTKLESFSAAFNEVTY